VVRTPSQLFIKNKSTNLSLHAKWPVNTAVDCGGGGRGSGRISPVVCSCDPIVGSNVEINWGRRGPETLRRPWFQNFGVFNGKHTIENESWNGDKRCTKIFLELCKAFWCCAVHFSLYQYTGMFCRIFFLHIWCVNDGKDTSVALMRFFLQNCSSGVVFSQRGSKTG